MIDTNIDFVVEGDTIDLVTDFGQTVTEIVAPDEYTGSTEVTPSDQTQVLQTRDRLVPEDITVNPAPTEVLSTDHNGTFTPSDGHVGFYQVDVDVNPDLRPLSVSENGSYQPDGFDGFSQVDVNVPQRFTLQTIADRSALQNLGEITIRVPELKSYMLSKWSFETIHLPETTRINDGTGVFPTGVKYIDIPNVTNIGNMMYDHGDFLGTYGDGDGIVKLKSVTYIGGSSFYQCKLIQKVYIYHNLTNFGRSTFRGCDNLTDVYVPWSEGAIANAPWEANNATIHYDTVYDEDWNVISST